MNTHRTAGTTGNTGTAKNTKRRLAMALASVTAFSVAGTGAAEASPIDAGTVESAVDTAVSHAASTAEAALTNNPELQSIANLAAPYFEGEQDQAEAPEAAEPAVDNTVEEAPAAAAPAPAPAPATAAAQQVQKTATAVPQVQQQVQQVQQVADYAPQVQQAVSTYAPQVQNAVDTIDALQDTQTPADLSSVVAGSVVKPAEGTFTSGFGPRWGSMHQGIDITAPIGTPILAVMDGIVIDSGPASGFGNWIRIMHDNGEMSVYGHMSSLDVSVGERVQAGQKIAGMGSEGFSTGSHLHFEIHPTGNGAVDPIPWFAAHGITI